MKKSNSIVLGNGPDGNPVSIDLNTLLRTRALIQANSGGGKSYLIRRLAEQLFGKVQVIIIDREGEFESLREKFGYLHVGQGGDTPADIRSARLLAEKILELGVSAVCDLYEAFRSNPSGRRAWVANFLEALIDAPKHLWRDLVVFVDEAHQFCPESTPKAASMQEREIISRCKDAMISLATVGRKRSFCAIWATQRLAKLDKDASSELFNRLVGMTVEDVDVDRAVELMSVSKEDRSDFKKTLRDLEPGNFFAFGRAITKERVLVKIGKIQTTHPEPGSQKNTAPSPAPEKIRHLLPQLADLPKEADQKAKNEADLKLEIKALKAQLLARPKVEKVVEPAPAKVVKKIVEVPAIDKGSVRKIYKIVKTWEKALDKLKPLEKLGAQASGLTQALIKTVEASLKSSENLKKGPVVPNPRPIPAKPLVNLVQAVKRGAPVIQDMSVQENGELSNPQKAILRGLREFNQIGIDIVSRPQLAGWLGKKVSGSYLNDLSRLRGLGFISYQGKGLVLTGEGLAHSPNVECDPTAEAIFDHVLLAVSGPQKEVLKACKKTFPEWISREDVAQYLGKTVSGSFLNDLSRLRTSEMIEYGVGDLKGHIRLCGWTMLAEVPV